LPRRAKEPQRIGIDEMHLTTPEREHGEEAGPHSADAAARLLAAHWPRRQSLAASRSDRSAVFRTGHE